MSIASLPVTEWILRLPEAALYDSANPLFFTGAFFLVFFLLFFAVYLTFAKNQRYRAVVVLLFSLWFYYKCSGNYVLLLAFAGGFTFLAGRALGEGLPVLPRRLMLYAAVAVNLIVLGLFKYTPYFGRMVELVTLGHWSLGALIMPAGISFYTFANLSYLLDVSRNALPAERSFLRYMAAVTFFPVVQMGPIERPRTLLPQFGLPFRLSREDAAEGFYLIVSGAMKKVVIGDYLSTHLVSPVLSMPDRHTGMENLAAVIGYSLVIYCDFSGYTDMARGIARWMGFRIGLNFNFPYRAHNIGEFWRRWHISLSGWLRDYLFLPLAYRLSALAPGKYLLPGRLLKTELAVFAVASFITFTLCGIWHGAGLNFLIWGMMHGVALGVHRAWNQAFKGVRKRQQGFMKPVNKVLGTVITFVFVTLSWLVFRTSEPADGLLILTQITDNFYPQGFPLFLEAYYPVLAMMGLGYLLHFAPAGGYERIRKWLVTSGWVWKTLIALAAAGVILWFKSLGSAMPIYIQF